MDAQKLLVHDGSQGQTAEGLHAGLVDGLGVLVLALELESKVIGQVAALVVASQQPQRVRVVNLERPQVQDALDTKVAAVDVIAEEQIAGLGRVAANLEQLHQVVVLAVDVAAHGDGGVHLEEVGLGAQNLAAPSQNEEGLLFSQATFAVEVLFEKVDVGLGLRAVGVELLVGGLVHGGSLDVCVMIMGDVSFLFLVSASRYALKLEQPWDWRGMGTVAPLQTRSWVFT